MTDSSGQGGGQPPWGEQPQPSGQPPQDQPQYGQPPQYGPPPEYVLPPRFGPPPTQYVPQTPSGHYGQQSPGGWTGGPQYAQRRRSRTPLFIGLGVVVAAGIVVVILLLAGVFSSSDDPGRSPAAAAKAYVDAFNNNDLTGIKAVTCAEDLKIINSDPSAASAGPNPVHDRITYTIGTTSIASGDPNTATVNIRATESGPSLAPEDKAARNIPFRMTKEHGEWKVCFPTS
jgi:hypothetical protein